MLLSDKNTVNSLVSLFLNAEIREVVHSPGSRNAPLAFSFAACDEIRLLTIVDERSAAFFALGMAQQLRRPVALICTSGTAVLNYAPAVAEAYYQRIPLLLITADRPAEWIDQADGQAIRQNAIYANYIGYSVNLETNENFTEIQEALQILFEKNLPVHINFPLDEPLYGRIEKEKRTIENIEWGIEKSITQNKKIPQLPKTSSVLLLAGQLPKDDELNRQLANLTEKYDVTILCETISNLHHEHFIGSIDRVLASIPEEERAAFSPDLLLTFDGNVLSKQVKNFLRKHKPREHWHIGTVEPVPDTYRCLSKAIKSLPNDFLASLQDCEPSEKSFQLKEKWLKQRYLAKEEHENIIKNIDWCDLQVFSILKDAIPSDTLLQVANSTPVRYVQLFEEFGYFDCYANRGTSGIDGCTSTAAGAAFASARPTLLITGDLSFLYDSNALWNNYLRPDFRIIVINNNGGGIFRYISGAMQEDEMSDLFEVTQQQVSIEYLSKSYGLDFFSAANQKELENILPAFFTERNKASILEIKTPHLRNAAVLKNYFEELHKKKCIDF